MPTPGVRVKDLAQSYAPPESLAQAIGSMLTSAVSKKQAASTALSSLISKALLQILEAPHRSARMLPIRHLVGIDSEVAGLALSKQIAAPSDLIGTAQTAPMLGYSRPHVAMLIDQHQLKGATVSAGGHHSFGWVEPSSQIYFLEIDRYRWCLSTWGAPWIPHVFFSRAEAKQFACPKRTVSRGMRWLFGI